MLLKFLSPKLQECVTHNQMRNWVFDWNFCLKTSNFLFENCCIDEKEKVEGHGGIAKINIEGGNNYYT